MKQHNQGGRKKIRQDVPNRKRVSWERRYLKELGQTVYSREPFKEGIIVAFTRVPPEKLPREKGGAIIITAKNSARYQITYE